MITVVLDSNIFISAFLFGGNQRKLLQYALAGKYRIFISDAILDEIRDVLRRPRFRLAPEQVKKIIAEIESICTPVYPTKTIKNICRDSKDHIILECAEAALAEYIVTGDEDLLSIGKFRNTSILNSASFLDIIAGM